MRAGPEARRRAYERQQSALVARREEVTATLREKYESEPDREYAEEVWGSMLRDRLERFTNETEKNR